MMRFGLSVQDDVLSALVSMQQEPLRQLGVPPEQTEHFPPLPPQAEALEPVSHPLLSQQPAPQEVVVHVQFPLTHSSPAAQAPVLQIPPHPSGAPQAWPVQLGVQPQVCAVPEPPHVWGAAHCAHVAPALPHASLAVPGWHPPAPQHPLAHDVLSQTQVPATQCKPLSHEPIAQDPPQPSPPPQVAFVQSGTHGPDASAFASLAASLASTPASGCASTPEAASVCPLSTLVSTTAASWASGPESGLASAAASTSAS